MHTFCSVRARRRLHLAVSTEKLSLIDPSRPLYHRLLYTFVFSALLFFPNITLATVIVPMSDTDLIQQSAAIVIGTVNTIESYWDADMKQIFTHVIVTPQEVLKGTAPVGNLTLKQLGGTVGQRHMWIDGSPVFTRGEKTILFLDTKPDGSVRVTRLFLGKFLMFTDRETRKEFVYRSHTPVGMHLYELGHVLGLGHSPSDESIMFALARFDGRGTSLAQEDKDGVAFLYPGPSFPPCSYILSASKRSVGGGASTGRVTVSTNSRCGWTTFTSADWISIVEGESSSGNGTVVYSVAATTGRKSRRARLVIAGQIFTITQKGVPVAPRKRPPPICPGLDSINTEQL